MRTFESEISWWLFMAYFLVVCLFVRLFICLFVCCWYFELIKWAVCLLHLAMCPRVCTYFREGREYLLFYRLFG